MHSLRLKPFFSSFESENSLFLSSNTIQMLVSKEADLLQNQWPSYDIFAKRESYAWDIRV